MAGIASSTGPGELASALAALTVRVESLRVEEHAIFLDDYPGGPRPSSVIELTGKGHVGRGENVAFTAAEHAAFAARAAAWFRSFSEPSPLTVAAAARLASSKFPYEHAAIEAALIDLAMRQAGLGLFALTGVREGRLRFVRSFAASAQPATQIAQIRASGFTGELKIDVDPNWSEDTLSALAREPGIAIFDFKGRGSERLFWQIARAFPRALLEDPPENVELSTRPAAPLVISRDATLSDARAVAAARARGEAVNLKAPRMGGPLELLSGLAHALPASAARPAYLGGMFEVGVGRSQAQAIAALYCHAGPNDLAPNVPTSERTESARVNSPVHVRFDALGFG